MEASTRKKWFKVFALSFGMATFSLLLGALLVSLPREFGSKAVYVLIVLMIVLWAVIVVFGKSGTRNG